MDYIGFVSIIIAILSIGLSFYTFRRSSDHVSYMEVDKQYLELLKLALDEPYLRHYETTSKYYKMQPDDEKRMRYDIYAYMCWNLIETIFDMQKSKKGRFKLSDTWVPVMFEENKLHYTWFKHNIRLFKEDFQRFVTSELNDLEISQGNVTHLNELYQKMETLFPDSERKSLHHLQTLMAKGQYHLILAKHKVFNDIVGFALVHTIQQPEFIWLDYMAIDSKYQNSGYGTLLFNKIIDLYQKEAKGVLLEVEKPGEPSEVGYEDKIKRIQFYKRAGATQLSFPYIFPTQTGSLEMHLMYKPTTNMNFIPRDVLQSAIKAAFSYIHSDIAHRDKVLQQFLSRVEDVVVK